MLPCLPSTIRRTAITIFALLFLAPLGASADTDQDASWYALPEHWKIQGWNLQTSLYTTHFDPDPDHNNDQKLIGVEAGFDRNWVVGGAIFDNSFGQNSQLLYMGKYWYLFGSRHWYGKVMAGFLHGYKEPYEDKIPFNGLGIAPVIIPSIGFRYKWFIIEGNLGGISTFTVTAGVNF
jgi:hypothetical protein